MTQLNIQVHINMFVFSYSEVAALYCPQFAGSFASKAQKREEGREGQEEED